MFSSILPSLVTVLAFSAGTAFSQNAVRPLVSRRVTEYLMPVTAQTHEVARVPGTNFLLLSQMSNSQLVKIELDPATEAPIAYQSFPMGKDSKSGLHGVWPSTVYPGMMWLSLQSENRLILVDPGESLSAAPSIIKTIDIPQPGNGPHSVFEIGNRVWAGLKVASPQTEKFYVFSADVADTSDSILYPCLASPVFIQQDPSTKLVYVTQDAASAIMSINITSGVTAQIPIPPSVGNNPVGLITVSGSSRLAGLWFSLAGNATGGTATFGRILPSTGALQFFTLSHPTLSKNTALLHLADASTPDTPALWLLSTSLLSPNSPDALIHVTFNEAISKIASEEYISVPTQNAMLHRILKLDRTVVVSELNTFSIAQLAYEGAVAGGWKPAQTEGEAVVYDEAS